MRLGAVQPGYLPWLGFFDQIARCDVFVLYDDLPFSRHSWRNRNKIKTAQGWCWLTVPVINKGLSRKAIREVEINNQANWRRDHWEKIKHSYARAPYFQAHEAFFAKLYERPWRYLVDLDLEIIFYLIGVLGIETKIVVSSEEGVETEYQRMREVRKDPTGRVAFLCQRLGAQHFLEGALGRLYMDPSRLERSGITLEIHEYQHPSYNQLHGPFIPYLSVSDLLLNHGPDSLDILIGRKVIALP